MKSLTLKLDCVGEDGFRLNIDTQLPGTGITAIYGPSGSGKTTLLQCIAGLRQAEPGSVVRFADTCWQDDAQFAPPWQRRIGYVFHDARLFPHLTVEQNLAYGAHRQKKCVNNPISQQQICQWLQLEKLLQRLPQNLSAGQMQRVAIGRALLSAPQILLMDEPLANLDHAARQECLYYLQNIHKNLDLPILYVSHDIEEVSQISDHLVLLKEGEIETQGSLLDLCSRLDIHLSHEEQAAAIVVGEIKHHDSHYGLSEIDICGQTLFVNKLGDEIGQHRRLRIPARDVSICRTRPADSSILNIVPVVLTDIEETSGSRVLLRLALGEQHLLARITRKSAHALQLVTGDKIFAQIKSAALLTQTLQGTSK